MTCYNLYNEYNKLGEKEKGFFYLIESFKYDTERCETLYPLIQHYCCSGSNNIAYQYYNFIKNFYENNYLESNIDGKLFIEPDKANFYIPYYMILVADKVKELFPEANKTIYKMYEIAFTKKYPIEDHVFLGNLLYNLQFFIDLCIEFSDKFVSLFQSYIDFLESKNYNLYKHVFLQKFQKYGIKLKTFEQITNNNQNKFSLEDCKKSNKILFYSGFSTKPWNYTYSLTNALGGSESALINLSLSLPSDFEIYIGGDVIEEKVNNITYVNLNNLQNLVNTVAFHTVIVSRYIAFYEMFPTCSFYQSFIWGHDILLFNYGCNIDTNAILHKWDKKINGCICQTEWHKNLFSNQYSELKDKIFIINNGIQIEKFSNNSGKITNKFVYTSCSERGLDRLLDLWPDIVNNLPDAQLHICSYNNFPQNDHEKQIQEIIKKYDNIKHLGCLNKEQLYNLLSSAEFWLYPTNFNETSCITAMEMLMSEVICVYYPIAGLVNTLGDYGLPVQKGEEINTLLNLTTKQKNNIRKRGKEYAMTCGWEQRAKKWMKFITSGTEDIQHNQEKQEILFKELPTLLDKTKLEMWKNLNVEPYYNFSISKNWFGYSELKNYLQSIAENQIFYNILEIGSFEGCSSCFFSDIILNHENGSLTCVDPFISDGCSLTDHTTLKDKFYSNISKSKNYSKIKVVEDFSDNFYSSQIESKFNFIYIDGEHSEKQILKDLDECFRLAEINALIWCDDYNNQWKHVFDDWLTKKEDNIKIIHSNYQLGFIKIKDIELLEINKLQIEPAQEYNYNSSDNEIGFLYGKYYKNIDITEKVFSDFKNGDQIFIPKDDNFRASVFGDPLHGVKKDIFLTDSTGKIIKEYSYNSDLNYLIKRQFNENCIKVINLERRPDRKENITKQLVKHGINNFTLVNAIDGSKLCESEHLANLFEGNNFNNNKGVIGCALSHLKLWMELCEDVNNNYYVILEDDIQLYDGFKEKLIEHCMLFQKYDAEHLSLGVYDCNLEQQKEIQSDTISIFQKDVYKFWNITFAYIISKQAAKKIIDFVNTCSIKCAIDNPRSYGDILKYHHTTHCIAEQKNINCYSSDIVNSEKFNFNYISKENKILICDFWEGGYDGNLFDVKNNFLTKWFDKANKQYKILDDNTNENPDLVIISCFPRERKQFPNVRHVYYCGEPFLTRNDVDYNITFNYTCKKNYRFPLWAAFLNDYLLEE